MNHPYDTIVATPDGGWLHQRGDDYRVAWRLATTDAWLAEVPRELIAQIPAAVWAAAPTATLERAGAVATVTVQAGGLAWQLPTTDGWPQPAPPAAAGDWYPSRLLTEAWRPVLPCMGADYSKPALCGLEISVVGGYLRLTATDTYRLGQWHSAGTVDAPDGSVVAPAGAVNWLAKQRAPWQWRLTAAGIEALGDGWRLWAEGLIGYPDYRTVAREGGNGVSTASLSAAELAAAVKGVTVGKPFRTVRLGWGWTDGVLTLTGRGQPGKGTTIQPSASASLAAVTNGTATITVDPDRLKPMLAALGKNDCTLHWTATTRPLSIVSGDYLGILMCCRE